jgi:hypothetical protein
MLIFIIYRKEICFMTCCNNKRCRHCFIDVENGRNMICVADPIFIRVPEARVFVLKCNTYQKRDTGDWFIQPLDPVGVDGLYPGQLKTPIDYSDFDPEELEPTTGTAPISYEPTCTVPAEEVSPTEYIVEKECLE